MNQKQMHTSVCHTRSSTTTTILIINIIIFITGRFIDTYRWCSSFTSNSSSSSSVISTEWSCPFIFSLTFQHKCNPVIQPSDSCSYIYLSIFNCNACFNIKLIFQSKENNTNTDCSISRSVELMTIVVSMFVRHISRSFPLQFFDSLIHCQVHLQHMFTITRHTRVHSKSTYLCEAQTSDWWLAPPK